MNEQPEIIEQNPQQFRIRVKLLSNEVFEFEASKEMRVSDFKEMIKDKVNVPRERMRIVFAGKQLLDDKTLGEYVTETGMTVHLIAKSAQSQQQQQQQQQPQQQQPSQQPQRQQQPQPPQQPNPFAGMMNMVNSMMSGNGGQGATIAIGNMGELQNSMSNMLGSLGINIPVPPQRQSQQPQQPQQQQPQQQPQQQQQVPPRQQQSSNREGDRIPYGSLTTLNQNLARLNLPVENINSEQELVDRVGVSRYLRRLHHQNTRALSQLNRVINLMEEGRVDHLQGFLSVFQGLNQANDVAIQSIKKLLQQQQQPQQQPQQQAQQQQQRPPQQQPQQGQQGQIPPQLGFQIPQVLQPPQQAGQQPIPPVNIGNILGGMDIGQLVGSMGGMGNLMNMSFGELMEGQSIFSNIFHDITGGNIMQSFTTKDFRYLNEKQPSIRSRLLKLIEEEGKENVINQLTQHLCILLVPQEKQSVQNWQSCKKKGQQILKKYVTQWTDLTIQEQPEDYANKCITLLKEMFGYSMNNSINHLPNQDQNLAFQILKTQATKILNPFIPGLEQMFYMLVQRQLKRVFLQFQEEEARKKEQSQEQALFQEQLIAKIKASAKNDAQFLASIQHSHLYEKKK